MKTTKEHLTDEQSHNLTLKFWKIKELIKSGIINFDNVMNSFREIIDKKK